jgi:hypothetical protein
VREMNIKSREVNYQEKEEYQQHNIQSQSPRRNHRKHERMSKNNFGDPQRIRKTNLK